MKDEDKLNFLTRDWVKEIISQVTDKDSSFFDIEFVSKIFERTQNNLKDTKFEYIEEDYAKKEYGDEVKLYLKSQGLPCVKLIGASNKVYLKEILEPWIENKKEKTCRMEKYLWGSHLQRWRRIPG